MISRLLKFNPLALGIWGLSQNALNVVINQTRLLKSRSDSPTPNLIAKEHNLDNETAVALRNHKATLVRCNRNTVISLELCTVHASMVIILIWHQFILFANAANTARRINIQWTHTKLHSR